MVKIIGVSLFFYSTFPTNKNNNDNEMDRIDTITLNLSLIYKISP